MLRRSVRLVATIAISLLGFAAAAEPWRLRAAVDAPGAATVPLVGGALFSTGPTPIVIASPVWLSSAASPS